MNLVNLLFGDRNASPVVIKKPPRDVEWRRARPRPDQSAVRAWRAEEDHKVHSVRGSLQARAGQDFIVEHDTRDHAVVQGDIFERTYEPLGGGLYRKRDDIELRYFTLDRPALIETLEGEREAQPGDWIMQGVAGELWPVPRAKALETYDPV